MDEVGGLGDALGCRGGPDGLPLDKPLGTCDAATVMDDGGEAATIVRDVVD